MSGIFYQMTDQSSNLSPGEGAFLPSYQTCSYRSTELLCAALFFARVGISNFIINYNGLNSNYNYSFIIRTKLPIFLDKFGLIF